MPRSCKVGERDNISVAQIFNVRETLPPLRSPPGSPLDSRAKRPFHGRWRPQGDGGVSLCPPFPLSKNPSSHISLPLWQNYIRMFPKNFFPKIFYSFIFCFLKLSFFHFKILVLFPFPFRGVNDKKNVVHASKMSFTPLSLHFKKSVI